MLLLIIRRLALGLLVLSVVAFISFVMFTYVGDPVQSMLGQEATVADREALMERLGLNDPFFVQFGKFLGRILQGDFGVSYRLSRPVNQLILERLPATLELALVSALFASVFGLVLGLYTAINRGGVIANFIMSTSLIGVSLPTFLIGILLIWVFSVELGWFPSFGRRGLVDVGLWQTGLLTIEGWKSLLLPALTLGLYQMTLIMRLVRSEMIQVLGSDFIRDRKSTRLNSSHSQQSRMPSSA